MQSISLILFTVVEKLELIVFGILFPMMISLLKIYVCEAAIDAISLYVIHRAQKVKEVAVYVSIGGVANQKTIDRLVRSGKKVVLAVDNDAAGQGCRDRNPMLESIIPKNKDWNDDLKRGDY